VTEPAGRLAALRILLGFGLQVRYLKYGSIEDSATINNPTTEGYDTLSGNGPAMGHKPQMVAGALEHSRIVGVAETCRSCCDLLENALEIGGRV
jgi:hypothetical protein